MKRRNCMRLILGAATAAMLPVIKTWKQQDFEIVSHPAATKVSKSGYVYDCLGVRKTNEWDSNNWNITHLPTGLALGLGFDSLEDAKEATERIVAAGDWSRIDGSKHPDTLSLKDIVLAIREEQEYSNA